MDRRGSTKLLPPIAAATLAGCSPIRAGFAAMRLGSVIYVIPFFFVLNPALIGHAPGLEVPVVLFSAVVGVGAAELPPPRRGPASITPPHKAPRPPAAPPRGAPPSGGGGRHSPRR